MGVAAGVVVDRVVDREFDLATGRNLVGERPRERERFREQAVGDRTLGRVRGGLVFGTCTMR